jgi:catechol 2,3-dioxygenase-like lactoylglutathione lyase family enzyme
MKENLFGVVIEVENIVAARAFYRDILQLGDPVMDSNFWVEFRLPDGFSLFLKKVYSSKKHTRGKNSVSWIYRVRNIGEIISRLELYGYGEIYEKSEEMGEPVYMFKDPEGNVFHLIPSPEI